MSPILLLLAAAQSPPPPDWGNGSKTYQYAGTASVIGGVAPHDRFAYGFGANIEATYVAIDTPPSARTINSTALAGYSRCNGGETAPYPNCVGVLGIGLLGADSRGPAGSSGGAWGVNALAVNAASAQAPARSGWDFGFLGSEFDLNVLAKRDGSPPIGNAIGVFVITASQIAPAGLFNGIQVSTVGVPWKTGMLLDPGAAEVGLTVGQAARAGESASMPVQWLGRDATGSSRIATISSSARGDLILAPAPEGRVKTGNIVQAGGAFKVDALPPCDAASAFTRVFVEDAARAAYRIGEPISGGGSDVIPAYCDGKSWRAG